MYLNCSWSIIQRGLGDLITWLLCFVSCAGSQSICRPSLSCCFLPLKPSWHWGQHAWKILFSHRNLHLKLKIKFPGRTLSVLSSGVQQLATKVGWPHVLLYRRQFSIWWAAQFKEFYGGRARGQLEVAYQQISAPGQQTEHKHRLPAPGLPHWGEIYCISIKARVIVSKCTFIHIT